MHNPPMIPVRPTAGPRRGSGRPGWVAAAPTNRPAKWSFISATIIEPSCATVNCHSKIADRAGVDLHDRATGYRDLTERRFVVPGDQTSSSSLLYLLRGQGSIRMPPDSPLPEADMVLIDNWIKAGALND